jgi:ATP-dependent RNA helicase DOB1
MGINMPARTVVFTASRKFDGTDFRWVSAGEYIQMSGRAGRRGLDDRGIVIQMIDEKMEPAVAKDILKGTADPLNSAFHLGYNMLLNLMRVEGGDPERMMQLSFHQFQNERAAPAMQLELRALQASAEALAIKDEAAVGEYFQLCAAVEQVRDAMRDVMTQPRYALPFLQPGRLARIVDGEDDWGWGVVVTFQKKAGGAMGQAGSSGSAAGGDAGTAKSSIIVEVLLHCAPEELAAGGAKKRPAAPRPASAADIAAGRSEMRVVPVLLPLVGGLCTVRLYLPRDLRPRDARDGVGDKLREVIRRFGTDSLPLLDPVEDMQIEGPEFGALLAKSMALQARVAAHPVHKAADRDDRFAKYKQKVSDTRTAEWWGGGAPVSSPA